MNDRLQREIDELLAQLGFQDSSTTAPPPAPEPVRPRETRGEREPRAEREPARIRGAAGWPAAPRAGHHLHFPGSPVHLMLIAGLLMLGSFMITPALGRPCLVIGGLLFGLAYLTWACEPDPDQPAESLDWAGRLYRRIYGGRS